MLKIETIKKFVKSNLSCILTAIVTLFVTNIVLFFGYVPTSSMLPTLEPWNLIIGTRFDKAEVKRYDVIVFKAPNNSSERYVKRIIGLPGEHLEIKYGIVYANGERIDDSFIYERSCDHLTFDVPEDCYFVMGDNRTDSYDSRFWENPYVHKDTITAIVRLRLNPFPKIVK